MKKNNNLVVGAAIVSVAAGLVAGLLTLPRTGKKIRNNIHKKASYLRANCRDRQSQ